MKKEALSLFGHSDLILFSFMLFFFTFIGVLFWALRKSRRQHYEGMANLPLNEDQKGGRV